MKSPAPIFDAGEGDMNKRNLIVALLLSASACFAEVRSIVTFPGGSRNGSVQFNKSGQFSGDTQLIYSTRTFTLNVPGMAVSTVTIKGITYYFPTSQTGGGFLKTDGAGGLTWEEPTTTVSGVAAPIGVFDGAVLISSPTANLAFDGTDFAVTLAGGATAQIALSALVTKLGSDIDLTSEVTGVLPAANLPTTVVYTNTDQTISGKKTVSSSFTVTGGMLVASGITTDSMTVTGISASRPVKTSATNQLTTGQINLASSNEVTGNLPVTNLNSGTSASSTTFWAGDGTWRTPAGTGGGSGGMTPGNTDYIQVSSTLQSGATFYVSSGTVHGELNITDSRTSQYVKHWTQQSGGGPSFPYATYADAKVTIPSGLSGSYSIRASTHPTISSLGSTRDFGMVSLSAQNATLQATKSAGALDSGTSGSFSVSPTRAMIIAGGVLGATVDSDGAGTPYTTILGSATVIGPGGVGVSYGAIVGSMTVSNLPSGECVQTTTGGRLTTTGAACGSGGGGDNLGNGIGSYGVATTTGGFSGAVSVTGLLTGTTIQASSATINSVSAQYYYGSGNGQRPSFPIGLTTQDNINLLGASSQVGFYDSGLTKLVALKSTPTITTNQFYTLPDSPGTDGQVLATKGINTSNEHALYWKTDATGGGGGDNFGSHIATKTVSIPSPYGLATSTIAVSSNSYLSNSATVYANNGGMGVTGGISLNDGGHFRFEQNGNTYQVVGSSTSPTVGQCAVWTSSWTQVGGACGTGGGGGSTGGTISPSAQYNVPFYSLTGSTTTIAGDTDYQWNGTSITLRSSFTLNTGGGAPADNDNVGLFNIFAGSSSFTGKTLFSVGSQNNKNMLLVQDNQWVFAKKLATAAMGFGTVTDDRISHANSNSNYIDMYNGGPGLGTIRINTRATYGSQIILAPNDTPTVYVSSNNAGGLNILSSATIRGGGGLAVTHHISASSMTISSNTYLTRGATFFHDGAVHISSLSVTNRMGIGTVVPPVLTLDVVGNSAIGAMGISMVNTSASNAGVNFQMQGHYTQFRNITGDFYITNAAATGDIILRTNIETERMRVNKDGNVGIGNAAPTGKLHVSSGTLLLDGNTAKLESKGQVVVSSTAYVQSLITGTSYYANYNSSGTITPNAYLGNNISIVLTSSATINIPINAADMQMFRYRITQDAAGSRTVNLGSGFTFGADVTSWAASTAANAVDYLGCIYYAAANECHVISSSLRGY